ILDRLKFSGDTNDVVNLLILNHMKFKSIGAKAEKISDRKIREMLNKWGEGTFLLLRLVHADNLAHNPKHNLPEQIPALWRKMRRIQKELASLPMPVKGRDVIEHFKIPPGKEVGILLKKAEKIWLDEPGLEKEEILKRLSKYDKK
ncbi:MAG: hypothetical protein PHR06_08490, partial [Candidatus Cloacimonetes bacterium]|nr:hypothetical protein [Candidatus Cloacimonadota bacterium]